MPGLNHPPPWPIVFPLVPPLPHLGHHEKHRTGEVGRGIVRRLQQPLSQGRHALDAHVGLHCLQEGVASEGERPHQIALGMGR